MPKPRILWLADQHGWAYDSIVRQVGHALVDRYDHDVLYMCEPGQSEQLQPQCGDLAAKADVIVSMFILYPHVCPSQHHHKIVLMATGWRPFEVQDHRNL